MGGFDLVILLIVVISIVVGVWRGFVKEALSIASWIMAFWLGNAFRHEAGEFLMGYINIPTETFRIWAGFSLVFIATLFAFGILSWVITKLVLHGPIKTQDRALGFAFGVLRGGVIVVVILLVVRGFGMDQSAWWQNSALIPQFLPLADWAEANILPASLQRDDVVDPNLGNELLKGVIEQNLPAELTEPVSSNSGF